MKFLKITIISLLSLLVLSSVERDEYDQDQYHNHQQHQHHGSNYPKSIPLSQIQTLTLRRGVMTKSRRTTPIPQLNCEGDLYYVPDVVQCRNMGSDGESIQWKCTADLPSNVRFGELSVSCEGFSYSGDDNVLVGSCGLFYTLHKDYETHEDVGRHGKYHSNNEDDEEEVIIETTTTTNEHSHSHIPHRREQYAYADVNDDYGNGSIFGSFFTIIIIIIIGLLVCCCCCRRNSSSSTRPSSGSGPNNSGGPNNWKSSGTHTRPSAPSYNSQGYGANSSNQSGTTYTRHGTGGGTTNVHHHYNGGTSSTGRRGWGGFMGGLATGMVVNNLIGGNRGNRYPTRTQNTYSGFNRPTNVNTGTTTTTTTRKVIKKPKTSYSSSSSSSSSRSSGGRNGFSSSTTKRSGFGGTRKTR